MINNPNLPTSPSESRAIYPVTNPTTARIIIIAEMIDEPVIRLRTTIPGKPTSAIKPTVRHPFAWIKSKSIEKSLKRKYMRSTLNTRMGISTQRLASPIRKAVSITYLN
jgi:hypothetical protein